MPLNIEYTKQFKRDLKKAKKQGKNFNVLKIIMESIVAHEPISARHRDHALSNNWTDHRELHTKTTGC